MKKHKSHTIFGVCDEQARRTVSFYNQYRKIIDNFGSEVHETKRMTPQEIWLISFSLIGAVALFFTQQAQFYQYRNLFQPILETKWLAAVIAFLGAGWLNSYTLTELNPLTRIFTAESTSRESNEATSVDRLVDQLQGNHQRRQRSASEQIRLVGLVLLVLSFLAITAIGVFRAIEEEQWLLGFIPPFLFFLDAVFGIGPIWIVGFVVKKNNERRWRDLADGRFHALEIEWQRVAQLYAGARQRFFEENAGIKNENNQVPPVSPLAAYFINNFCEENVIIPDSLLRPGHKGGKKDEEPRAVVPDPEPTPPPVGPVAGGNGALEKPEDLFAAMDSKFDANSEKL